MGRLWLKSLWHVSPPPKNPCLCLFSATIITAWTFIPFKHICTVIQSNGSPESKKIILAWWKFSFVSVTTATVLPWVDKSLLWIVLLTAGLYGMTSCNLVDTFLPHLHVAHWCRRHQTRDSQQPVFSNEITRLICERCWEVREHPRPPARFRWVTSILTPKHATNSWVGSELVYKITNGTFKW